MRPPTPPRPTTIVESPRLSNKLGVDLLLASETLQYTGSFKFRAAYHVASNVRHSHIITASSGNFGQAIAYACKLFGKRCTVVMPSGAPRIKVDAVREYGAEVDLVDVSRKGRLDRLGELASEFPDAYVASPYDDDLVIEGNSSLAKELFALDLNLDFRRTHNLLGTSIREFDKEDLAARVDFEYELPIHRGGGDIRGIDAYAGAGVFLLADRTALRTSLPGYEGLSRIPVDLTFDLGVQADTVIGLFKVGFSTLIGFLPDFGQANP